MTFSASAGVWTVSTTADKMTGEKSAYATSDWTNSTKKLSFPYNYVKSAIGVGCNAEDVWVYFIFDNQPNISNDDTKDGFSVSKSRIKYDGDLSEVWLTQVWGGKALHVGWNSVDKEVARNLMKYSKVLLETRWYSEGNVYHEYSLSGSTRAIKEALAFCGQSVKEELKEPTEPKKMSISELGMLQKPIVEVSGKHPFKSIRDNISGNCTVTLIVMRNGLVKNDESIECTDPMFKKPSIKAANKLRYKPLVVDGNLVEFTTKHTFYY